MSLHAGEIDAVVRELAPLAGARVDAVRVHAERALTLELYGRSGPALLLLSAEPDVTRLHAVRVRPPQPPSPFPFQAVLRREIEGARLVGIESLPGDRVVALVFETPRGALRLVGELTGRHGNLFLLGADGIIRASAGRNLSQRRKLVPGEPYEPPANPPSRPERPRFTPDLEAPFPLSAAIEAHYAALEQDRIVAEGRRRLREPVRAGVARAGRALAKLAEEAARVPAAAADRRMADLLKPNLRAVKRGAREVTVIEWTEEGPREVQVALDPALTPQANLERYYRRYRRIVESATRVAARTAEVRGREVALRALLGEIDVAPLEELPRLEREARRLGAGPRPQQPARPRSAAERARAREEAVPYRAFRSASGAAILVGRGAAENDRLTLRVARGNDLWLHARGIPGAHVVVRLEKGRGPDQDTLLDAANLAVHFSDARGEPQADVAYTRAKFVRKQKGAAPGAVTYSQEKVLLLRSEPQRVERLLAEEEGTES
jgi:predicted ribosome quality control (RQC) complex YloA/Tae2 family protein